MVTRKTGDYAFIADTVKGPCRVKCGKDLFLNGCFLQPRVCICVFRGFLDELQGFPNKLRGFPNKL